MEKFIPYEKLSKKEKRKLDNARRQTWGRVESHHKKIGQHQGLQQKKATGLEERTSRFCRFLFCINDLPNMPLPEYHFGFP